MIFIYLSFVLGFVAFLYREHTNKKPQIELTFELPSKKPPAIVGMMVNPYNRVTTKELIATLVDLAYRKKIEMKTHGAKKDMLRIRLLNNANLEYFEKYLLEQVLELKTNEDGLILEEKLKTIHGDKNKKAMGVFLNKLENWKNTVIEHGEKTLQPGFHEFSWQPIAYGIGMSILIYLPLRFLFAYSFTAFLLDMFIGVVLQTGLIWLYTMAFKGLNPEAQNEKEKWLALKKTLDDYTSIKTKRPEEHIIWDRILPYAVALGVSHEIYRISEETMKFELLQEYKKVEKLLDPIDLGKIFIELIVKD